MATADDVLIDSIRAALRAQGEPARAAGQQAYMKSAMPFHGVAMPQVRRLTSSALAIAPPADLDAAIAIARRLWDEATHREERYAALAICRARRFAPEQSLRHLDTYRHFIATGAWWDLVDETAHLVEAVLVAEPQRVTPLMRNWAHDDCLWVRRAAIICQLGRGVVTDVDLLRDTVEPNLASGEFFIRKACGWALRQYARTDPAWVRSFVDSHAMSGLTRREALKHVR